MKSIKDLMDEIKLLKDLRDAVKLMKSPCYWETRIVAAEKRIEELKLVEKTECMEYKLHTHIDGSGPLHVGFFIGEAFKSIGHISSSGKCFFLSGDTQVEAYETWREHGLQVCADVVEWKGGVYRIGSDYSLCRADIGGGNIYYFKGCEAFGGCSDNNLIRFEHNDKPILF
jgi:hypothetical protein